MTPSRPLRPPPLPPSLLRCCLAIAAITIAAPRAEAQPGASWSASGDVAMTYRITNGGTVYGRNASNIDETLETDIIATIEVGGTSGNSDDDPGSLSIGDVGDDLAPRDLGEVDVNVGTLTLNDSFVTGRIDVNRPTGVLVMLLSGVYGGQGVIVHDGGTFTAQASRITGSVREGGIARVSGCTGGLGSVIGADIEIDGSILGSADFQGKQIITNTTITTLGAGRLRQGDFDFANVSLDVEGEFTVGGNTTGAVPTDTIFLMTSSVFESATAVVRAGLGIATDFTMRGSTWRSFGLFQLFGSQVDIGSGSQIDARADLVIANAHVTVASIAEESRIDVAGDLDVDGGAPSATTFDPPTLLTVGPGGVVEVQGTLTIGEFSTLNIDGGTVRVGALDNQGTLNDPAGALTVPEATGAAPVIAAALGLALLRRRRD